MNASRSLAFLFIFSAACVAVNPAAAQRGNDEPRQSPNAAVSQTIGTTVINLHYSRPGVRGRTVFGDLARWGQVWRAGANEPTTITFSGPVQVQGQEIAAGEYNIFVRPNENADWDVIFTEPVRWGTMFDQATPVLEVKATPSEGPEQEWLSYSFENLGENSGDLVLQWADRTLPLTITVGN